MWSGLTQMHPYVTAQETVLSSQLVRYRPHSYAGNRVRTQVAYRDCHQEPAQSCSQHRPTTLSPLPTASHSERLDVYK